MIGRKSRTPLDDKSFRPPSSVPTPQHLTQRYLKLYRHKIKLLTPLPLASSSAIGISIMETPVSQQKHSEVIQNLVTAHIQYNN